MSTNPNTATPASRINWSPPTAEAAVQSMGGPARSTSRMTSP